MKKWLSFLLLSLLCLTLGPLGSVAAKSSADFTDLKDLDAATKAKFDAMISAGVFEGVSESTFGLKEEMNRAQFAKVAALIFGLEVDKNVNISSFSDVKADDPANGYALPYIEAIKAAGITDGVSSDRFNPAGEVTKEQLATFFVRGLDMKEEALSTPPVKDETVSDWAKSYVALALEKKLMVNGADGNFGGTVPAVRELLVTSSYEAKKVYVQQVEEKQRLEEEKKQQEEKTEQPVPVQPPVIVSPPVVEPPVTVPPVPPVPTNPTVPAEPPVPVEPPVPTEPVTPPVPPVLEQVAMPTASIAGGPVIPSTTVKLETATPGATIHYTTNGSTPTRLSPQYRGELTVLANMTVQAIAVMPGLLDSDIMSVAYTVSSDALEQVAMPTADIPEGTVTEETLITLTSATEGASIYYTMDGSTPTNQSMLYDAPISITEDVTIKAIAVKSQFQDSEMLTLVYTLDVMEDPNAPAEPFKVVGLEHVQDNILRVTFNRDVNTQSAGNTVNYEFMDAHDIHEIPMNPETVNVGAHGSNTVDLDLGQWYADLASDTVINLSIHGVLDLNSNEIEFGHHNAQLTKP
ncbi:chitobiase/beta-hexosaminidase C-terminal domain-containing protein [Paenibacillus sp. JSM ZJ436]|uniref:chitobiase/beta-hexosaminidase C-terminal domain-containing protein n=1 Tax=Paenibacillus sp. JSM ZJ436 TaxID=3376190 RepID=UPI0037A4E2C9